MGSINEHNAAAQRRALEHARTVCDRFERIDESHRQRILALLSVAGHPIEVGNLILADRKLGGGLGGSIVEQVELHCRELFAQGKIDLAEEDGKVLVFRC